MSKKTIVSLGSIAFLGTTAYSLSLLNSNTDNQEPLPSEPTEYEEDIPEIVSKPDLIPISKPTNNFHNQDLIGDIPIWDVDGLPFEEYRFGDHDVKALKEAWKKAQPIRYSWKQNKNNRKTSDEDGPKAINLIRDYTFKFSNGCAAGTFWILDYEIPDDPKAYPTKFFFGTNAHVIQGIKFQEDPYDQKVLPYLGCQRNWGRLTRETNLDAGGNKNFMWDDWDSRDVKFLELPEKNNVLKWLDKEYEPIAFFYEFKDPKLVYLAVDFAGYGKDKWGNKRYKTDKYMSDFAVVEIDFGTEAIARKMTRNFHDKYHYKTGTHKDKAINFFAEPLMKRKTNKQLYEESPDFYIAGYPVNGLYWRSVGSYNMSKKQASKLTYYPTSQMIKDENGDDILGHVNSHIPWGHLDGFGEPRASRGVMIILEHERLSKGSSGSLTTDGERNAIGVKSRKQGPASEIDVFRSPKITYKGETIIPEYDLIEGVESNPDSRSYKDSIVKYVLSKGRKTHLSEMRQWKAK